MKLHPTVTLDRVLELCESNLSALDDPGLCIACGAEAYGVEPDARKYKCEACGAHAVYGAEELLLHLAWPAEKGSPHPWKSS